MGGAREGSPRQSRKARVVKGGWIWARIFIADPQRGHCRTSMANTRRINSDQE